MPQPTLGSLETTGLTQGEMFPDTVTFQKEEGRRQGFRYGDHEYQGTCISSAHRGRRVLF